MNFLISNSHFLKALHLVSKAISNTIPLPSLAGIYLSAKEGKLSLIASDSNISIRTYLSESDEKNSLIIKEEGEIVINAHMLSSILQKLNNSTTEIELIDSALIRIRSGKAEYKINAMKAEDYPPISFDSSAVPFELEASILQDIRSSVAFSVSTDETRPALTGVNLRADGKELHCAATDSFRLATKIIPINHELHFNIVLPAKYLDKVSSSLEGDEKVNISLDKQKISFSFNNTTIAARLIDDSYPEISHLLPKTFAQELYVNSHDILAGIDRTSILRFEGKNTIKMIISSEKLEISALNQEVGSLKEEMEVVKYLGDDLTISCSGKFLADAIKVLRSSEVKLSFNGELRPIILTNPNDSSLTLFVSPVRSYD